MRELIAKGADVNFLYFGVTPLEDAITMGRTKVVQLLVNSGANLETRRAFNGTTPLYHAVSTARPEIVKILLAKGAKVNVARPSSGRTPLMESLGEGSNKLEIFKLLLKKGADVKAKDKKGRTALDIANILLDGAKKYLASAEKKGDTRQIGIGQEIVEFYEKIVAMMKGA